MWKVGSCTSHGPEWCPLGAHYRMNSKRKKVSVGWKSDTDFPERGLDLGLKGLAKKGKAFKTGGRANAKTWRWE